MINFDEIVKFNEKALEKQVELNQEEINECESDPDQHHDVMMNCVFESNNETYDEFAKRVVRHHLTEQGVLEIDQDGHDVQIPVTMGNLQEIIYNVAKDLSYVVGAVYQNKPKDTLSQYTADLFNDINN